MGRATTRLTGDMPAGLLLELLTNRFHDTTFLMKMQQEHIDMPRRYRMGRRAAAMEDTRRRIVEATFRLHQDRGIAATRWEDIAERAGVSVATVYRHFPSLDELIPACGELTTERLAPPSAANADQIVGQAGDPARRLDLVVRELCRFYERADRMLRVLWRDMAVHPDLSGWNGSLDAERLALIRIALGKPKPEVAAATAFPVWRSFVDHGFAPAAVERQLVLLARAVAGLS